jgi:Hemerythrin HHE cation binding domain/Protein of unknown function (DUF3618)
LSLASTVTFLTSRKLAWRGAAERLRSLARRFAGRVHDDPHDLDVADADQASNAPDLGIQSCWAVIGKDAYRKRITMTTSDPVLYPLPQTETESVRQDAARTRVELAETVEALAARFNVRRQVVRKIGSAGRRSRGIWAGGLGATAAVLVAGLTYPGGWTTRRRRWATAGAGALVGMATFVAVDRPRASDRRSGGQHESPPGSSRPGSVPAGSVRPGLSPSDALRSATARPGRDVVDVLLGQHRQIDGMFDWVRSTDGADRREAFAALVDLLHRHERAEGEIVHPVLDELDGPAVDVVAERRREEAAADRALASLISRGTDHPRFVADLDALHRQVLVHAAGEEAEEFPLLRARLSNDRLRSLANQLQAAQTEPW